MKPIKTIFFIIIILSFHTYSHESRDETTDISTRQQSQNTPPLESSLSFSPSSDQPLEREMDKAFKAFKKALFLTTLELMSHNPRVVKEYCDSLTSGTTVMKTLGALACSPIQNSSLGVLDIVVSYLANFIYYPLKENFYLAKKIREKREQGSLYTQEELKKIKSDFYNEEYSYWYEEDYKLMSEAEKEYFSNFPKREKIHKKIQKSVVQILSTVNNNASQLGKSVAQSLTSAFFKNKSPSHSNTQEQSSGNISPTLSETDSELSDQDIQDIKSISKNSQEAYLTNYFSLFIESLKKQWQLYNIKDDPEHFFQYVRDSFKEVIKKRLDHQSTVYLEYFKKQQDEWYNWLSTYKVGFIASTVPIQLVAHFFSNQIQNIINFTISNLIEYLYNMLKSKIIEMANYNPNVPQPELIIGENAEFFDLYAAAFETLWYRPKN